ncbi:MAG TPA: alpha/beta hydrolase [Erysipelothrix sp.]
MKKIKIGDHYAYLEPYLHQYRYQEKIPTILLCPGGAYLYTSRREAAPVAYQFLAKGYHVFVLHYSTISNKRMQEEGLDFEQSKQDLASMVPLQTTQPAQFPTPLIELAQAMMFLHDNSEKYHIDTDHIITMGFSAGANLVSLLGSHWHRPWLYEKLAVKPEKLRPFAQIIGYGYMDNSAYYDLETNKDLLEMMSLITLGTKTPSENLLRESSPTQLVTKDTPPSFVWHTRQDALIPVTQALDYISALNQQGVSWELHIFDQGDHGYASATLTSETEDHHIHTWINLAHQFIVKQIKNSPKAV